MIRGIEVVITLLLLTVAAIIGVAFGWTSHPVAVHHRHHLHPRAALAGAQAPSWRCQGGLMTVMTALPSASNIRNIACEWKAKGGTYGSTVYSASSSSADAAAAGVVPKVDDAAIGWPALILVSPIGVGINRSFYDPFLQTCAIKGFPCDVHVPELWGVGDSSPLPTWRDRPITPAVWAAQLVDYSNNYIGPNRKVVIVGQGGCCPIALQVYEVGSRGSATEQKANNAVKKASEEGSGDENHVSSDVISNVDIAGFVLLGPSRLQRLTQTLSRKQVYLIWRIFKSPLGLLLFLFARRRKFLRSFSEKNLFAQDEKVTDDWVEGCVKDAKDVRKRFAVFAFLSSFYRLRDYTALLRSVKVPSLILTGRDVGKATKSSANTSVESEKGKGKGKTTAPVDPIVKVRDFAELIEGAEYGVQPGWNVLPYEEPEPLLERISNFMSKHYGPSTD